MSARMVLLGPPGAGKGTQAARIAERLGIPAISTGDIFRANVAGATELGTQAKAYMDKGEYVPDSITNAMVADRIAQADCENGFLLDGYPRTTAQVGELDSMLKASGLALDGGAGVSPRPRARPPPRAPPSRPRGGRPGPRSPGR